jgi:hypothetical protein
MIKLIVHTVKKLVCPEATQDLKLNTKNRDAAVKAEHVQYGPLNVNEPGDFWKDIADSWNTSEKAAKKSLCGNCVAFDISPRMKDCMPGETMVSLDIAGCITLSVTLRARVEHGQKVDQLQKMKNLQNGKKKIKIH